LRIRFGMKFGLFLFLAAILVGPTPSGNADARPKEALKAAFVRGGDLWIKSGGAERQATKGEFVRNPKWSSDGEWIAYTKGEEERELVVLHVPSGRSRSVSPDAGNRFSWAPGRPELAYLAARDLYTVRPEEKGEAAPPKEIAQGIGNFSWLPDGNGFVASTASELLPDGWKPVKIVQLTREGRSRTLYELPKATDDFFAVGTSVFKFSASGKWMAFLATPTASLSADSNFLCVLADDGTGFQPIDRMVRNEDWFEWPNRGETLAYIGGIGREAYSDKKLKTIRIPASGKPVVHTPKGYVDQSLAWEDARALVVARAAELSESGGNAADRPLPKLVRVELQGNRSRTLTNPPKGYGDFSPSYLPGDRKLIWVRSDRKRADAMISGRGGKPEEVWIRNLDLASDYYGQWKWREVLAVYP